MSIVNMTQGTANNSKLSAQGQPLAQADTLFLRTMLTSEGAVANSVSDGRSPTKIVYQAENQDYSPSVRAST